MEPTFKNPGYTPMPQYTLEERIEDEIKCVPKPAHKKYVAECIKNGLDRKAAAKIAGVGSHVPSNLDSKANKAVDNITQIVAHELGITAKEVIAGLKAEATATARDVTTGAPLDTTAAARVGAWKLLGQSLSMFTENVQTNSKITVEFVTDWRGEKVEVLPECEDAEIIDGND